MMTRAELIEKLKKNVTVFGELSEEEQCLLVNLKDHVLLRVREGWERTTGTPWNSYTYRIDPAYIDPAPEKVGRWVEYQVGISASGRYIVAGDKFSENNIPLSAVTNYPGFGGIKYRDEISHEESDWSMFPLFYLPGHEGFSGSSSGDDCRSTTPIMARFWGVK